MAADGGGWVRRLSIADYTECQSRIHLRPTSARRVGTDEQGFYRRETEETETSADTKIFYLFGKVRTRLRRTTARQAGFFWMNESGAAFFYLGSPPMTSDHRGPQPQG